MWTLRGHANSWNFMITTLGKPNTTKRMMELR